MRNKRCEILEVAFVARTHVALSFTHRISTAHMSSNEISISVMENNHVTGIKEYTCSNNTCNMNGDPYDKNIETINTCIPLNICNSDV